MAKMSWSLKSITVISIVLSTIVGIAGVIATWFAGGPSQAASTPPVGSEMIGRAAEHGVAINAKGGAKVSVVVDSPAPAHNSPIQLSKANPPKTGMHADARADATVINADGNAEVKVTRPKQSSTGVK